LLASSRETSPPRCEPTLRLLDSYGDSEGVRVKLAILKLAAGDVAKVRRYVRRGSTKPDVGARC
jgi:hypothetical protein